MRNFTVVAIPFLLASAGAVLAQQKMPKLQAVQTPALPSLDKQMEQVEDALARKLSGDNLRTGAPPQSAGRGGSSWAAPSPPSRRTGQIAVAGIVAPSSRAKARELPLELFAEITVGTSRAQVIEKLGEAPGRVAGAADDGRESWTYVAAGGAFVKVKLKDGLVTAVVLPEAH